MKKTYIVLAVILTILVSMLPFAMHAIWLFQPKKVLQLAIIDKTVLTKDGDEHKSLNWVLNNANFSTHDGHLYSVSEDYYGFFPQNDNKYAIRDFEKYDSLRLKNFADKTDAIFLTDTYGLYKKEWFGRNLKGEYSPLIYGGTSAKEINLLKLMNNQHKLIISEFNTIASPTTMNVRVQFEAMFGLKWTGWAGRYFDILDTTVNKELPVWVVRDYKDQHNNQWPFKRAGIVFVKETGRLEILEYKRDLDNQLPEIISNSVNQKRFGIPQKLKYSYWFDVMKTKRSNNVISVFQISCNSRGDSLLKSMQIPNPFPAVIERYDKESKFYYLCGDFSDNPVELFLSRFYGISNFKWVFFSQNDPAERESFFWQYYQPLIHTILTNYQDELRHSRGY